MRLLEAALKAAGDPTRTRVLKLLEGRELCVCQIQAVLRLAASTVSKHLALLKAAGLVDDRRDGRWMYYSLAAGGHNPYAGDVLRLLGKALGREPRILDDRRRLREILAMSPSELCALVPAGRIAGTAPRRARPAPRRERRHA